jgi:hypothetical protein
LKKFNGIKALLNNSKTFYLISVGTDSNYAYVNEHYADLFTKIHGELVGKHYSVTIHPEDLWICGDVSAKCFAHPDQIFPATIRKHDGEGGYIATQWDYKAMFDEDQKPVGVFCIGYDITEFLQTTAALSQLEHIQSHVIRKPIANLLGLIALLNAVPLTSELESIVEMIGKSALELDNYIKLEQEQRL